MIEPIFGDAEELVVSYIQKRAADFPLEWSATGVAADPLPEWTEGEEPKLTVRCEQVTGEYPVTQAAAVRVTSWADSHAEAKELARLAHAALLEHNGDAQIAAVQQLTGVVAGTDPQTPAATASCTALVVQRPL